MFIDVIIPIYKSGKEFVEVLNRLMAQTVHVHKIILINTEESLLSIKNGAGIS